jgi:SDR family mycofactocin-dependent oxidoreductase
MGLLEGKVAFITGGARAQGRAHAVASAREGADVVFVDILTPIESVPYPLATQDDFDATVAQVEALGKRVIAIEADVRSQEALDSAVDRTLEEFGRLDILIANAGVHNRAPFWEMTEAQWDEMIAINLTGVWKSAKAVTPHMISSGSGSIVLISSVNGIIPGNTAAHYTAAKHGVVGLMRSIALELAPHGIRCNSIHPGLVLTGMTNHQAMWDMASGHEGGTQAEFMAGSRHYFPFKGQDAMDPMVIANSAVYLNSDLAAGVTGTMLPVEGGHLLMAGHNWDPA